MVLEDVRKQIADAGYDNPLFYDAPSFDASIIGVDESGKVVYDYDKMIDEYIDDEYPNLNFENSDEVDEAVTAAMEWISYNTIRATPYAGPLSPIIIDVNHECEDDEEKYINLITFEDFDMNNLAYKLKEA